MSVPFLSSPTCQIIHGDSRTELKAFKNQVDLIVTSPPYADARRGHYDSVHPDNYVDWFETFHQAFWDALKPEGSLVINIKDKVVDGVRHRYVWRMIDRLAELGWLCIDDYLWAKKNSMPGYWPNRLRDGWEYIFHLAKCKRPYMNQQAVRVPVGKWSKSRRHLGHEKYQQRQCSATGSGFGRVRSRWLDKTEVLPSNVLSLSVESRNQGHPAAFPVGLPVFFIKLLSAESGLVVDPFGGSGTTAVAALELKRRVVLIDNNANYCQLAKTRISNL